MEFNTIDLLFWGFIILVVLGGLVCLVIFLPKEHDYEDKYNGCYRIQYRDGVYSLSSKKPSYGENGFSLRSKYFYITRIPCQCEAFCDDSAGADGNRYRAAADLTVCFPEDRLQVFAPTFQNVSQDAITEMFGEALSGALDEAMAKFDPPADEDQFKGLIKEAAQKKLDIFGAYVMHVNSIKISPNR